MSTIGTRGDVQPLVALGVELQGMGHSIGLCVAPNFKGWVESFGFTSHSIGPDLKQFMNRPMPAKRSPPTKPQRRQLAEGTVREQFRVLIDAARDCDLLVGGGALQLALRSIGEALSIPYVYVAYCPASLPSPNHPPPKMLSHYPQWLPGMANRLLWRTDARGWNTLFRDALNEERANIGLSPVIDVQRYVFTNRPWVAADPVLAPAPHSSDMKIVNTGAWFARDDASLPEELEEFLASGDPPVYLGFGSMRASQETGPMLVDAARRIGRRSILSQGWAGIGASVLGDDCLVIGDVSHATLFPRVAAVVHHGGAGTTHATARAGRPHVIVPHNYDQFYWAYRVEKLGIGVSTVQRDRLTVDALVSSLERSLLPRTAARAEGLATRIRTDGAREAARQLCAISPSV
ncbi:MAG TPA: glycosyltransferase [Gemmatimonadaceae bacterium]|nr:glycosyltransferase [Gemmatimonadaceae bacterium]